MDVVIDISPIRWDDWMYLCTSKECATNLGISSHYLVELGKTTPNYRYSVYYKQTVLISQVIRLGCCCKLLECPIGDYKLPHSPCREALRAEAKEGAHLIWVEFVQCLTNVI